MYWIEFCTDNNNWSILCSHGTQSVVLADDGPPKNVAAVVL